MPRIQIQMLKGRTAEQKRRLAKGVTEAASEARGISQERISLIMVRQRGEASDLMTEIIFCPDNRNWYAVGRRK